MCDPFSLLAIAGGLAGTLLAPKPPKPPTPEIPAAPAPTSKAPGATVRVGGDDKKATANSAEFVGFTEKRKQGKALGGLGRGGLTI